MSLRYSSWTLPLSAVLAACSSLGCNSILGIEEATLDPNWDQTSTGGSNGSGGSDGSGGDASGGSDGTGGSSASCDEIDASDLPQDLLRGCVLRASCDPWSGYSASFCMSYGAQRLSPTEECTKNATSCAEVDACLGRALLDDTDTFCSMSSATWICAPGNVAYNCDDSPYKFDCSAYGGTCVEYLEGATDSGMPPCTFGASCDEPAGEFHCSGDNRYECIDGVQYGTNCAMRGGTCVEMELGDAYCENSQTSCSDTSGNYSCNGKELSVCSQAGLEANYDCSGSDLSCNSEGYCLAPGCSDSDANECSESCSGTSMKLCIGGAPVYVDCVDYGFSSCEVLDEAAYCWGAASVAGDDSCEFALDNTCEEPADCAPGTDTTDCVSNSCTFAFDGTCDEGAACEAGTDSYDCSGN